jgi:fructose-1-phosphate kinase PfkB-like protein
MLEGLGIEHRLIPIAGNTRVSHVVFERSSGQEYRFTPEGPELKEAEWRACLEQLERWTQSIWSLLAACRAACPPTSMRRWLGSVRKGVRGW